MNEGPFFIFQISNLKQNLTTLQSATHSCPRLLKSGQRQWKPWRGTWAMDEPKVWFEYEQQVQQIYTLSATLVSLHCSSSQLWHALFHHHFQHMTTEALFHPHPQKYFNDLVKWSVLPTLSSLELSWCSYPSSLNEHGGKLAAKEAIQLILQLWSIHDSWHNGCMTACAERNTAFWTPIPIRPNIRNSRNISRTKLSVVLYKDRRCTEQHIYTV